MKTKTFVVMVLGATIFSASPSFAANFSFSTGTPDGKIGTATRPESSGKQEIETADDFILNQPTSITSASFTGLLTGGASVNDIGLVRVEIYRVFPKDSDQNRTIQVPTRENSPSDIALAEQELPDFNLTTTSLGSFSVLNTVVENINPFPNQFTGGEGPTTGEEVRFDISFSQPFSLPADHYFFVPQVEVSGGEFLWLSAPKPIVAPGTSFAPDLQSWIRDQELQPDWLRIGTDITAEGPFNASFSLAGEAVPEPFTILGVSTALAFGTFFKRKLSEK
ncbi:MAG: hypothetical protein N5P05_000867 [Chroococcopsis gigantea SAG 12.99]|jgi:hypothetical protein|nr:PEP-CTERM sorting domain-containing protein [Chlorogloea purpurea SAG 13.99]MDV2999261.1 hypothetical protein [Chroococcopsis gigantea SAG 12.99]